jgi:hypothetical protein
MAAMDALAPSLERVSGALKARAMPLFSWGSLKEGLEKAAKELSTWEKIEGDLNGIANQLSLIVTMSRISRSVGKKFVPGNTLLFDNLEEGRTGVIGQPATQAHEAYARLCAAAVEYLARYTDIPINEDWTALELEEADLSEPPAISIFNPGLDVTWDDWSDTIRDNPDGCSPPWAFFYFAFFVFSLSSVEEDGAGVAGAWRGWSDFHEWNVDPPWWLFVQGWNWDYAQLRRLLRRSRWPDLATVLDVVYHETGNWFLDFEFNEGYSNLQPYVLLTEEDLRDAIRAGHRAKRILDRAISVGERARNHAEIYQTFLELAERSLRPSSDRPACNGKPENVKETMAKLKEQGLEEIERAKAGKGGKAPGEVEEETEDDR